MITVEEALAKILAHAHVLEPESVPILDSLGQVLAEDIVSSINVPPLDNAAMDGYAVRAGDTNNANRQSPRLLRVIDTVSAGAITKKEVIAGTAVRIMTGAPVPKGADAVVRFEDTDEEHRKPPISEIGILYPAKAGLNIRRAGEDISSGSTILCKGTILRPAEIGVLASLGRREASAIRRPVVAILATGNELEEIGQRLAPGKIYNSNSYSIAALVKKYGGIPKILGIARDSAEELTAKIRQGLDADMLITSGGVSAGDYDIVKDILAKEGEIGFWTVRMKPGKPLAFGTIRSNNKHIPHLGFPGNPVSTMITFELFARPALLKMMGKRLLDKPSVTAVLEEPVTNREEKRIFARAVVSKRNGQYHARLTGPQGSGILTSMSQANGLAVIPEDRKEVRKGETVRVLMLDWNEEVD